MRNKKLVLYSIPVLAFAMVYFSGIDGYTVKAGKGAELTTTPQPIPFSQNWSIANMITSDDNWNNVPGIVGYRGDDLTTVTGTDPRTIAADGSGTPVDVNANQVNPDIFITGGVAEFDGIANPTIALNGSGTADAPHIVVYLNTTGLTGINFTCSLRDLDASADDAAQQIDIQYRVGGTGSYTSVQNGYFADVTTANSATQVTPVNVFLPQAASDKSLVEVRVITTNAPGNDEWVGVDNIQVNGVVIELPLNRVVDLDGDARTDWVIVRGVGPGQMMWMGQTSGAGASVYVPWGTMNTDIPVPVDYDGDNKSDIAVWRSAPAGEAAFYILQSNSGTVRAELFGQAGDDPSIVGDYDGDGKDDLAVARRSGGALFWHYRVTAGGPVFTRQWGLATDFVAPGDYDGDARHDFVVQRGPANAQATFFTNYAVDEPGVLSRAAAFGLGADIIAPGDYDGDGKTDIAIVRDIGGFLHWFYQPSTNLGTYVGIPWGLTATDYIVQGDYDGDGRTDLAVWRTNSNPAQNFFLVRRSSDAGLLYQEWGVSTDFPVAAFNSH